MSKRGIKLYVADIKDAIRKIEKYTKDLTIRLRSNNSIFA